MTNFLALLLAVSAAAAPLPAFEDAEKVELAPVSANPAKASLLLDLTFEKGWHLNPDAPFKYSLDGGKLVSVKKAKLPLSLPLKSIGKAGVELGVVVAYCRGDGKGVCKQKRVLFHLPVTPDPKGSSKVTIKYKAD